MKSSRFAHPESEPLPPAFVEALAIGSRAVRGIGRDILYFPTIGSTNDVASAVAVAGGAEGLVVVADAQTAGRGRRGRTWFSPPGSGLYVSVVLDPRSARVDAERATALLTITAAVALAEAIEYASGLKPEIKWPNDLIVDRRKLAGILAEAVAASSGVVSPVVLGYGINVGLASYPPDLANRATSLEEELGRVVDRAAVFAAALSALDRRYDDLLAGRFDVILDAWRERAPSAERTRVSWTTQQGSRSGVTAGIDDRGALLVRTSEGVERIVSGEMDWS